MTEFYDDRADNVAIEIKEECDLDLPKAALNIIATALEQAADDAVEGAKEDWEEDSQPAMSEADQREMLDALAGAARGRADAGAAALEIFLRTYTEQRDHVSGAIGMASRRAPDFWGWAKRA